MATQEPPKMKPQNIPRTSASLLKRIWAHPVYQELPQHVGEFVEEEEFEGSGICRRDAREYLRMIWKYLYLGEPLPQIGTE